MTRRILFLRLNVVMQDRRTMFMAGAGLIFWQPYKVPHQPLHRLQRLRLPQLLRPRRVSHRRRRLHLHPRLQLRLGQYLGLGPRRIRGRRRKKAVNKGQKSYKVNLPAVACRRRGEVGTREASCEFLAVRWIDFSEGDGRRNCRRRN